jgi:UDP-3-O-[3-hydroxymyristoyl] glucosamine N-acyltransferase
VAEGCVVGAGAEVGAGAALHPNAVGEWAVIGPGTVLGAGAGVRIGAHCVVHSGARLGFAYRPTAPGQGGPSKAASSGGVIVGNGVEIGPNTVIEEGERRPTTIADGVRIGALACIGHDCSIGPGTELVAMVGLAGGVQIGAGTLLMGQVGVSSGAQIGDHAVIFGQSGVIGRVPDGGRYMGYPAWPRGQWLRGQARLRRSTRPRPAPPPGP